MKKLFNLYQLNYEKITVLNMLAILLTGLISIVIPFISYLTAFFVLLLFPILALNVIILHIDLYNFYEAFAKQFEKVLGE
jgi:hypothetical protein